MFEWFRLYKRFNVSFTAVWSELDTTQNLSSLGNSDLVQFLRLSYSLMYCKITPGLKIAAIRLYERGLLDLDNILDTCMLSCSTFFRTLKLYRTTGDVVNPEPSHRFTRKLDHNDIHYLCQLMHNNPDNFLNELTHLLKTNRFISVHYTTICAELIRAGITCKRLKCIASKRCESRRAAFVAHMSQYEPEELGFIDETSKDERTVGQQYG